MLQPPRECLRFSMPPSVRPVIGARQQVLRSAADPVGVSDSHHDLERVCVRRNLLQVPNGGEKRDNDEKGSE